MIEVGAYDAKTHLSSLLDRVSRGEEIVITKHGKAIARLVPAEKIDQSQVSTTIDDLLNLRKEISLKGTDWKELRDAGRR